MLTSNSSQKKGNQLNENLSQDSPDEQAFYEDEDDEQTQKQPLLPQQSQNNPYRPSNQFQEYRRFEGGFPFAQGQNDTPADPQYMQEVSSLLMASLEFLFRFSRLWK